MNKFCVEDAGINAWIKHVIHFFHRVLKGLQLLKNIVTKVGITSNIIIIIVGCIMTDAQILLNWVLLMFISHDLLVVELVLKKLKLFDDILNI